MKLAGRIGIIIAATFVSIGSAQAQNLETYYQKAVKLNAKRPLAVFSSDLKPLINQFKTATKQIDREEKAARKSGKTPAFCPPKNKRVGVSADEVLAHFRSIPRARRMKMSLKDGVRSFYAKKMPCR